MKVTGTMIDGSGMRKARLLEIYRCDDCDFCIYVNPRCAKCDKTKRKMKPKQFMNEGFPKDCPLKTPLPRRQEEGLNLTRRTLLKCMAKLLEKATTDLSGNAEYCMECQQYLKIYEQAFKDVADVFKLSMKDIES
jgi:hypothetical protein